MATLAAQADGWPGSSGQRYWPLPQRPQAVALSESSTQEPVALQNEYCAVGQRESVRPAVSNGSGAASVGVAHCR